MCSKVVDGHICQVLIKYGIVKKLKHHSMSMSKVHLQISKSTLVIMQVKRSAIPLVARRIEGCAFRLHSGE